METVEMTCFLIVGMLLLNLCQGISIDVKEDEVSDCVNPPVKIICEFTSDELQVASNELIIMHGGLTMASCKSDSLTCTTAGGRYNVTIETGRAVLTISNMDVYYSGTTWGCYAGPKMASLKLRYFRAATESLSSQFLSLRQISIVDVVTLFIVITILLVLLIKVVCVSCCHSQGEKEKDVERCSCSCISDLFSRRQKQEVKTGYTGHRYEVKTSYIIEDPHHIPDASCKTGLDRKTEAELACKNVPEETKKVAAEKLTEYVEARKPLISTSNVKEGEN
ncbi:uncharacterized protein LOC127713060 [Mytilus californianus]|uniref:uncharacterized protein LOC127713060 n=1 Tax=Mytilus californianus TaxID=6549 RepID=UPI002247144D|nr:uncharacterized protein LOC127713060 [Mytilus californianus]